MIELVATDLNLKELLPHAIYYSERTNVLALPDNMAHLVPKCTVNSIPQNKPKLTFSKKTFYLNETSVAYKLYAGTT